MRYRLQRHDGTDCSATMVPITVLRMVPIQRYRQNTSATLYLPAASMDSVTENGRALQAGKEGIKEVTYQDGMCKAELLSGTYHFVVK